MRWTGDNGTSVEILERVLEQMRLVRYSANPSAAGKE